MESRSTRRPGRRPAASFLKVLALLDYDRVLRVPSYFSRKYKKSLSNKTVTLRMIGKTWVVYVEKTEDGRFEFTRGWRNFVDDVGLQIGEFVICKLVDEHGSTFDVSVYGVHCGEWEALDGNESDEEVDETESFVVHLRPDHYYYMTLPKEFAEETGIINKETGIINKQWIKLQNKHGREWWSEVCTRQEDGRTYLERKGWSVFWKENNLRVKDEIMFVFDKTSPHTLAVSTKGNSTPSTSGVPKAKRGRPPKIRKD